MRHALRILTGAWLPLLVALGVGSAAAAAVTSSTKQLQANKRAAIQDARRHLASVRLPAGVSRIGSLPSFAKSFASGTGSGVVRYDALAQALWSTGAKPRDVIAYAEAHAPRGSTRELGSGSGTDGRTGVSSIDIQFTWPAVGRQLLNRTLTVTVVTPRHGRSVIAVQTQSAWFVPRPQSSLMPEGVHAVVITLSLGPPVTGPVVQTHGHVHRSSYVVRRAARVKALIELANALPIVQPSDAPIACPLMLVSADSRLTLAFKTSVHGSTLARIQVAAQHGQSSADGGGACNPISYWIGSKQQTALASPSFVKQVGKLIGADIS